MALDKLAVYNLALAHLGDHRLDTLTDDVEARYALDSAWDRAVAFVFQAAFWRFAMKTASLSHNGALTALAGYTSTFAQPATYYRPHAIFVLSGSRECPVDVRQQGVLFHANVTPIYLRYVDSALIGTVGSWPETVAKALGAYLAFLTAARISQDPQSPEAMFGVWQQYFGTAQQIEAVAPDPYLDAQLSGAFLPAVRYILAQAFWDFSVKTATIADSAGTIFPGFTYGFTKPADWIKTQALYLESSGRELPFDVRDNASRWSANVDEFNIRYLSTAGLDATTWPPEFRAIVEAYLAARDPVTDEQGNTSAPPWLQMLQAAMVNLANPESPWLRHQLSGRFVNGVLALLEEGHWRFAIKTSNLSATNDTPSSGYGYAFDRPADWLRTFQLYEQGDSSQSGLDFREEGGQFHANYSPLTVRYVSRTLGLDASLWSSSFEEAVLAKMELREAMDTPGTAGAVISAYAAMAQRKEKQARSNDDTRERPRVNAPSRFVNGRFATGWGRSSREQG